MVNLDEAYENDIGWPTEIILAKLTKWPEINIFVKLTQMLITCVLPAFITVKKDPRIKELN